MNKALNIDNKEFISASRASEKTGYSSDYIGQLCRAKKIEGKLIGKTWYVELDSVIQHKKTRKLGKKVKSQQPVIQDYFAHSSSPKYFSSTKINGENILKPRSLRNIEISYEKGESNKFLPELNKTKIISEKIIARPEEIKRSLPVKYKKNSSWKFTKKKVFASFILLVLFGSLLHSRNDLSKNFLVRGIQGKDLSGASLLGSIGTYFGNVKGGYQIVKDFIFNGSDNTVIVTTVTPETTKTTTAIVTPSNPVIAVNSDTSDLRKQLEHYIDLKIAGIESPVFNYYTTASSATEEVTPVIYNVVTKQSSSDVDYLSRRIDRIIEGLNDSSNTTIINGDIFAFTPESYGVSTSTTIGFTNGLLSTASSTFTGKLTVQEICFIDDACETEWPSGGGGSGGGTWSTTTSSVAGVFFNYSNDNDDVVLIGSNSSTTAEFFFDPNILFAKIGGDLLVTGSTTLQNFTARNSTTTNLFSTTASSTNLFSTSLNTGNITAGLISSGNITSGTINGQTISSATNFTGTVTATGGLTSLSNLLLSGSSTLLNFTALNSTSTNATTTNSFATNASSTNLYATNFYGGALTSCTSNNVLTWSNGQFGCEADDTGFTFAFPFTTTADGNSTSTRLIFGNGFISQASSTFTGGFVANRSTTTNATSTNLFSTTASSTNLFATSLNTGNITAGDITSGNITSGTINGQTISSASNFSGTVTATGGLTSLSNLLLSGSSTLRNFTALQSTTTNSTSTNFYSTTASSTNLYATLFFGGNLTSCTSNNVLTWSAGSFGCEADDQGSSGGADFPTVTTDGNSTSTRLIFGNGFISQASSTFTGGFVSNRSTTTQATTTYAFNNTASSTNLYSTNANLGLVLLGNSTSSNSTSTNFFSTTASSTNLFSTALNTGNITSGTINGQTLGTASTFTGTVTATGGLTSLSNLLLSGSSTLLNFTALQSTTTNSTSTNIYSTTASSTNLFATNFFGAGLSTCQSNNVLTWAAGVFGCEADDQGAGSTFEWTPTTDGNSTSTRLIFGNGFISQASSTFTGGFVANRSTTTNATSTNSYATTASSTNLFATSLNTGNITAGDITSGNITSGTINGQTISSTANFTGTVTATGGLTTLSNLLLTGSSTLRNFTALQSTTTNSTSTNSFATTASSTNLFATNFFGGALTSCTSNNVLTWSNGQFGCEADDIGAGGGLDFPNIQTWGNATSTTLGFLNGFISTASSTFTGGFLANRSTTTQATTTNLYSDTSSSTNLFSTSLNTGLITSGNITSGTINGQTLGAASTFTGTVTATGGLTSLSNLLLSGSSTLLNFTALQSTTTNSTSTNFYSTTASSTNLYSTNFYGGTLTSCTSNNVLTWSNGQFGCETDDNSGAAFAWTPTTDGNSTSTRLIFGNGFISQASSTFTGGFVTNRSTTTQATTTYAFNNTASSTNLYSTNANLGLVLLGNSTSSNSTSTNLFSTTASSTNLFSTALNTGNITSGTVNGQTISSVSNFTGTVTATGGLTSLSNLLLSGSSTLLNFTALQSTTTNSTSTNFFATTASTTNLFSTALNTGLITSGTVNGQTISSATNFTGTVTATGGLTSLSNLLLSGSSTLLRLTFTQATGTNATTTNSFATTASSTNLFTASFNGAGLSTCTSNNVLTWTGGLFGCETDDNSGAAFAWTPTTDGNSTSTRLIFGNGFISQASSTFTGGFVSNRSTTTQATTTYAFNNTASSTNLYSTNANLGLVLLGNSTSSNSTSTNFFSTTASSTNLFSTALNTGNITSGTINGQTLGTASTFTGTVTATGGLTSLSNLLLSGSSTLLNFTALQSTTTNSTSTNIYSTTASSTNLFTASLSGAGLTSCTSNNVLTWTGGLFGCEVDDNTGAAFAWTPTTDGNSTSTRLILGNGFISQASSTFTGGFVSNRSTTTQATTTYAFNNTASSTNLYSTNGNIGYAQIGNSTTSNATTTNLFATTASTTNFFGAGLNTCQTNNVLTWSSGLFGCEADDQGSGGNSKWATTTNNVGIYTNGATGVIIGDTATSSSARLTLKQSISASGSGTAIAGAHGIYTFNPTAGGVQVGDRLAVTNSPTGVANTAVGQIFRIEDSSALANLVRGVDITASGGNNTLGVNTGLRAVGHTFGVQGITTGLAGGTLQPAALYGEHTGTSTGNVLRLYSDSLMTPAFATFYQASSTYSGTGLLLDFAQDDGEFTGLFADFQKAGTSLFRVDANGTTTIAGKLGIGTTSPSQALTVAGGAALNGLANGAGTAYLCLTLSTGVVSTSTSACNPSSLRFKENVEDLSYGLDDLMALRAVSFDYKPELLVKEHQIGFIAEELAEIIPEVVGFDENGLAYNVDYAKITPLLVKSAQQLNLNLQTIASTTATTTEQSESFAESFFGNIFSRMTKWLADATNGIENIFAKAITTEIVYTKEICIEDVCIDKAQLQALLNLTGQTTYAETGDVTTTPPEDNSTTTEEVIDDGENNPEPTDNGEGVIESVEEPEVVDSNPDQEPQAPVDTPVPSEVDQTSGGAE